MARPERFLNAHWLNPAYLVPLVELSPGAKTDEIAPRPVAFIDRQDLAGDDQLIARGRGDGAARAHRRETHFLDFRDERR